MQLIVRYFVRALAGKLEGTAYKNHVYFIISLVISLLLIYTIYYNLTSGAFDAVKIVGIVICCLFLLIFVPGIFLYLKRMFIW